METDTKAQQSEFVFSTPAKFILSGEHSVVYGKDAIATTVDLRTYGRCVVSSDQGNNEEILNIELRDTNNKISLTRREIETLAKNEDAWKKIDNFMSFCEILNKEVFELAGHQDLEKINKDERIHFIYFFLRSLFYVSEYKNIASEKRDEILKSISISLTIVSKLPIAKGVGSSASYLVTVASCLIRAWETILNPQGEALPQLEDQTFLDFKKHANNLAFNYESIFHAKPSGLDNSSVTYGGVMVYNRVEERRDRINLGFLTDYHIVLIDSGVEKNTKKTVSMIRTMADDGVLGQATHSIIDAIGNVTKSIVKMISDKDLSGDKEKLSKDFAQLIKYNHYLLKSLNLSNQQIDQIIEICEKYGFPAKLTGGGQGGYCVCFIPKENDLSLFLETLKKEGFETLDLSFEDRGLCYEKDVKGIF